MGSVWMAILSFNAMACAPIPWNNWLGVKGTGGKEKQGDREVLKVRRVQTLSHAQHPKPRKPRRRSLSTSQQANQGKRAALWVAQHTIMTRLKLLTEESLAWLPSNESSWLESQGIQAGEGVRVLEQPIRTASLQKCSGVVSTHIWATPSCRSTTHHDPSVIQFTLLHGADTAM